jgi:hypothetical protein
LPVNWTIYERKLKINGNITRDRQINLMKDGIINSFADSPSYRSAYFNGSTTATDIQIIDSDKYYIKTIQMKPNENINVGDLIVFDSRTWLCTEVDKTNPVFQYGKIYLSTQTITLYKNNTSYQIPCVIQSGIKTSQLGTDENTYIEMPSSTITMRLPNTAITRLINRDEVYQIGLQSYSIKDLNDIIEPGLLVAELKFSQVTQESHVYGVTILNGSSISIQQGSTLQINVQATDNSKIVSSPTLSYSSSDTDICTVSSSGVVTSVGLGDCVITVLSNGTSDTIAISVIEAEQHNYTVEMSGSTSIIKGNTSTYTCEFKDNGVLITDNSIFYLTADDGISATTLATISSRDGVENSCVITAGNILGYVKLFVKNDGETIVSQALRIQIKSLF